MGRIIKEGSLVNFTSATAATIHSLKVYFEPKQAGSGIPAPDNVREINGWNGLTATRTGKSIAPFLVTSYTVTSQYNGYRGWANLWEVPDRSAKYTYSAYINNTNSDTIANVKIWMRDETTWVDGTAINGTQIAAHSSGISTVTIDMTQKTHALYLGFGFLAYNTTISNPMVEYGDTSSLYEPYSSSPVTVDWQSTAGTLYGGYVDLVSGELVQTHEYMTDTWGNWGAVTDQGDGTELRYIKFTNPVIGNGPGLNSSYCNITHYSYQNAT